MTGLTGMGDGTLTPRDNAARAQIAPPVFSATG